MRVVFAGTPEVALPALHALAGSEHDLAAVITRPDAPAGRGRRPAPSPVARLADQLGVAVLAPGHPGEPGFLRALADLEPECCPVVGYGALLPQAALDVPDHGWVNLHFSCLPAWRGAAPVQHAVWAGDEVTGATTFRLVRELDAGPTFGVMTERVRPHDTAGDLLARLAEGGARLLLETLAGVADGTLEAREQPEDGVSLAPKIEVADAEVAWSGAAVAVDRQLRACTPAPGAWTTLDGSRLKLGPLAQVDASDLVPPGGTSPNPGEVRAGRQQVVVGTATTPVLLGEVKPAGRGWLAAADWARGARLSPSTRLGGAHG